MTTVLAIDIGGTKFAAALVDPRGAMLSRAERPVGPDPTATLGGLIADIAEPGVVAVGIGSAGPIEAGTVSPVNIPAWRGFPLTDMVAGLLPGLPVALAGDAQCMALGEWWKGGRDAGSRSLLDVVVSTGIGGGLILDGRPYTGPTGNAGHIGHIVVDPAGEPCPCGATGCLETVASGPSMVRWARANGWTGHDARELATDAGKGAPVALGAFRRAAQALARGIHTTATLLDLDEVVIGGGVAAAGHLLLDPLRQAITARSGFAFAQRVRVGLTTQGREAGLYGAAALAYAHPEALSLITAPGGAACYTPRPADSPPSCSHC
ncbi:ROK family protein [Nonomuraea soli]|uniref:Glucokinase n=1 Tax=Nonomuraea soli TaxID=1032476 RepID=A0A7W0CIY7_9ACTN|nr:ROK family protein [Nonomuraea soli]MBA2892077.1 glucokinase [Nonomuraea soli]